MKLRIPKDLVIVYLCITIAAMGIGLVVPLIPIILVKYHITPSIIGLTTTAMSLSVLIFSLPVGKLIDRYGGKPIIGCGLLLYGVSMLFFPSANKIFWFMFWRVIEGAGAAAIWVGTETQINFYSNNSNRTRLLGFYATFAGIGFGTGPLIGSLFLEVNNIKVGFYATFFIVMIALLSLIIFMDNRKVLVESVKLNEEGIEYYNPNNEEIKELKVVELISLSLGAAILYGWMESSISTLLTIYLQQLNIISFKIGITLFVFVLGGVMVPPLTGYLADRYGKSKVTLFFTLCLALTTYIIPFQQSFNLILPFAFLTGAAGISIYITALASLGDQIKEEKLGTANGYFAVSYSVGSIIGPFLAGLGFEWIGKEYLFWQISGLAIIYFIFYFFKSNFKLNEAK